MVAAQRFWFKSPGGSRRGRNERKSMGAGILSTRRDLAVGAMRISHRLDWDYHKTLDDLHQWIKGYCLTLKFCALDTARAAFAPSPYAESKRGNDANIHDIHVRTARSASVKIETDRRSPAFGRERTGWSLPLSARN